MLQIVQISLDEEIEVDGRKTDTPYLCFDDTYATFNEIVGAWDIPDGVLGSTLANAEYNWWQKQNVNEN